jgi:excisionase family DNA binding protein
MDEVHKSTGGERLTYLPKQETRQLDRNEGDTSNEACNRTNKLAAPEPELYTPFEMAQMLRVPLRTIEKWVLQRRIPVVKCGRLNRFPRVEIQKRILSGNLLR